MLSAPQGQILEQLADREIHDEVAETFDRNRKHLSDNGVDIDKTPLTLGPWLPLDPENERFVGNPMADAMLTRQYREPFVVPQDGEV